MTPLPPRLLGRGGACLPGTHPGLGEGMTEGPGGRASFMSVGTSMSDPRPAHLPAAPPAHFLEAAAVRRRVSGQRAWEGRAGQLPQPLWHVTLLPPSTKVCEVLLPKCHVRQVLDLLPKFLIFRVEQAASPNRIGSLLLAAVASLPFPGGATKLGGVWMVSSPNPILGAQMGTLCSDRPQFATPCV